MLSLKTFEMKITKTVIFMTFSGRVKLKRYMNASLMSNGTFFCIIDGGAWSLVLRHDKWIFYSSAWRSDFLMNGRTTKLLLARKKKGVVHKRRPQLGGGVQKLVKIDDLVLKKCDMGKGGGLKIRKKSRRRLWMVLKKKEGKIMESFQDCLLQHTNTTTYWICGLLPAKQVAWSFTQ